LFVSWGDHLEGRNSCHFPLIWVLTMHLSSFLCIVVKSQSNGKWPCPLYPQQRPRKHQKGSLFDDLIGGDQQARWNCQAKCLRGFAVDDSFELRRRLHRKVSGFCTAQDAVDIGCLLSRQIDEVSPVIHETARCDENTDRVNRGQAMQGC